MAQVTENQPYAGPSGGDLPPGTDELGWIINQIRHGYHATAAAALDTVPGGLRGMLVLGAAATGCAPNQIEVARRYAIDRTVMVRLLDDMERAGLVERRPDPADRRARMIVCTEQGLAAYARAQEQFERVRQHVLAPLDEEEQETFLALARRVAAHLVASDPTQGLAACAEAHEKVPDSC